MSALLALSIVAVFTPFVLFAGGEDDTQKRLTARFVMLRSTTDRSLSTAAVDELLRSTGQENAILGSLIRRIVKITHADRYLEESGSKLTVERFLAFTLASCIAGSCLTLAIVISLPLSIAGGLLAAVSPVLWLLLKRKRRITAMEVGLQHASEIIVRALRAGHSLPAAIGIVGEQGPEPVRSEFAEVFRKQKYGLSLREAFSELIARTPSQDFRLFVTALLVQKETGGNLAQVLERAAMVVRERLKLQKEVKVHTAQGRFTGWVLCALPPVLLALINLVDRGYSSVLLSDPIGRLCLYAGVALCLLGIFLIHRIVNKVQI